MHEPSVPHVATPWSVHWFSGSWPAGTVEQVPPVPVRARDMQLSAHAVRQQTPCAHWFELHSPGIVQAAPLGSLPQLMLMQLLGATQSAAAVVQLVLHAVADAH